MTLCFLSHFNIIHATLRLGMWSSGTWSTQEVPNTRSQYLWWAGTILLFILNIILYDHDYHHYYLNFSRPHQDYHFAALPGRPFLASRGTTISVMWLAAGERWWVPFRSDTKISVHTISCEIFAFVKIQISADTWYNYYRSRDCKILIL